MPYRIPREIPAKSLTMKRRVLIIVENLPVPFDGRVWKEALSLHENGYVVTVLIMSKGERVRKAI